jgi:acetyltransferase-like isoleucine patch superfamily enzyme
MAKTLDPAIQDFFNTLCCGTPPSGVPPTLAYTKTTFSFSEGNAVDECPNTLTGDPTITLSISPSLPAGLTFDTATGCISGTPTEPRLVESYTVTATNAFGTATDSFNLVVAPLGEITITGAGWDTPANAKAYIANGSTTATNVSYDSKNDILYWTEPTNTEYNSAQYFNNAFMEGENATGNFVGMPNATTSELAVFNDPNHRITKIRGFNGNTKNHNLNYLTEVNGFSFSSGNYIFGNNVIVSDFSSSAGNLTFGNGCDFTSAFNAASGDITIGNNATLNGNSAFALYTNGTAVIGTGLVLDIQSGSQGIFSDAINATVTIGNGMTTSGTTEYASQSNIGFLSTGCTFNIGDFSKMQFLFSNSNDAIVNFLGNIDDTEGQDVPNWLIDVNNPPQNITINALVVKETSNGGGIEGDLQTAINGGFTVNFIL